MRRIFFSTLLAISLLPCSAYADSLKSIDLANNLGTVLAAEKLCALTYDHAAIAAYIEKEIPANDMDFPSSLRLMTADSKAQQDEMSDAEKIAHCTQIKRIAKSYGFTTVHDTAF